MFFFINGINSWVCGRCEELRRRKDPEEAIPCSSDCNPKKNDAKVMDIEALKMPQAKKLKKLSRKKVCVDSNPPS